MPSSTFDALTAADLDQLATRGGPAELRMRRWAISFLAALMLAVVARLFGIV